MKENKGKDSAGNQFMPSIISLSAQDAKETSEKLIDLMNELVASNDDSAEPECLTSSVQLGTEDPHDIFYWDDEITKKVTSGNLWFRAAYSNHGKIVIRFMSPRPPKNYGKTWLGVSVVLSFENISQFVKLLQKFEAEIRKDEREKFKALLGSISF